MSEYESPEQRQIRELRNQIYSLNSQNSRQSSENNYLRQQIENIRRQQSVENERVMQQMRAQQERIQQQQRAIQQERVNMSSTIQELDREVRERERLQNEKIVTMREQHARQIDSMNAQFREETEGLRGDIQRVQSDTRRNSEEIQRTQAEMKSRLAELRTETDRKLREQKDDLQRTIVSISTKLEEKITSVDAKVQSLVSQMAQKESDAKELSIYWVQEAERLVRELKETYRDSLFDEKRLRRLEQNLRDAQQDIETGHYDSAIKTGRDTFRDAMEMKEDLAALDLKGLFVVDSDKNIQVFGSLPQKTKDVVKKWRKVEKLVVSDSLIVSIDSSKKIRVAELTDGLVSTIKNIEGWNNVKKICVYKDVCVALFEDGKIAMTPYNDSYNEIQTWKNISDIVFDGTYVAGLSLDGTIKLAGKCKSTILDAGRKEVGSWTDIVSICCSNYAFGGYDKKGRLHLTGKFGGKVEQLIEEWSENVHVE